jgi:hypothetical protein
MVNGQPATLQDMAQAVTVLAQQVGALKAQLATDEQTIQNLRTTVLAIGDRAGCGYEDLGPGAPFCPTP